MSNEEMTLFSDEIKGTPPVTEPEQPTDESFLEQYVGEGKKYATPEELAKAYANADSFIETLKVEKRGVETELETVRSKQKTAAELVEEITSAAPAKNESPNVEPDNTELTPEAIQALVDSRLEENTRTQAAKTERERIQTEVWNKLDSELGSREAAVAAAKAFAGDNPEKVKVLDQLAFTAPDTLVAILKPLVPESVEVPAASEHKSTITSSPVAHKGLTWSQCQRLRREDRAKYNSREFQVAMHKAANQNKDFFNT